MRANYEVNSPKISQDNNGAALKTKLSDQPETLSKSCYGIVLKKI